MSTNIAPTEPGIVPGKYGSLTMSFFDSVFDFVGGAVDVVADLAVSAVDVVMDNPGKVALVCVGTVATTAAAVTFAAPIAAFVGATGLLGATASGTAISSLSGVALTNASLAALGGGSLAVGGGGMVAGATVVATSGAVAGAAASTGVVACS